MTWHLTKETTKASGTVDFPPDWAQPGRPVSIWPTGINGQYREKNHRSFIRAKRATFLAGVRCQNQILSWPLRLTATAIKRVPKRYGDDAEIGALRYTTVTRSFINTAMNTSPPNARQYNSRLGLILFAIYLVLYLGFVFINAFAADWMEKIVLAGLNLAIVYGFALIVIALLLAGVYGLLCRAEPSETSSKQESGQ